ncbi:DUF4890 domain-containing protein [Pedobacter deserti]|uniref:DUF4890 domain-containing protein n=1 Tax=Pedobacter deserti TaxID=2817382 RepID=UPI00210C412F|nr:DUF4890 domain-containing protein [Pedobacter sp. SYSU D00382]
MRKLIFTAAVLVGLSTMAFAQDGRDKGQVRTPEERAKKMTERLNKDLSLTADQQSKIYALNLEAAKKAKEAHVKGEKKVKADRAAFKAAREAHENQINSILTDQQKATYKELKAKRMEAMKDRVKKKRGA